jgi:hypothetical protein
MNRRQFLTLCLALVLAPLRRGAEAQLRKAAYDVDVGLLYQTLSLELTGTLDESVDRAVGRYEMKAVGQGSRISNRMESSGVRRQGRWVPLQAVSWFQVAGREARTEFTYDYARGIVEYHYRGETFFLRRLRVADDVVAIPDGLHVDDASSAVLNYADGLWPEQSDGNLLTHVVRRRRPENEGPDDVQKFYRAELVPFVLRLTSDPETGKPTALFDLTRFSSWAREARPARIIFGPDRRPELITAALMLGTSLNIRLKSPG